MVVSTHTRVPVPKVLAWSLDASNPVGVEYIVMEKATGQQLFKAWSAMTIRDRFSLVEQLSQFEAELASIQFPANGSLYLRESMTDNESWVALDQNVDPSGQFCIGPSCERAWSAQGKMMTPSSHVNNGPCKLITAGIVCYADATLQGRIYHLLVLRLWIAKRPVYNNRV